MSRRSSYSDKSTGQADARIRDMLHDTDSGSHAKNLVLNIINNELTQRQKQIIMLYYYKNMDVSEIAQRLDISPQAVSAVMARGRKRIYNIIKYYYLIR